MEARGSRERLVPLDIVQRPKGGGTGHGGWPRGGAEGRGARGGNAEEGGRDAPRRAGGSADWTDGSDSAGGRGDGRGGGAATPRGVVAGGTGGGCRSYGPTGPQASGP
eukprot:5833720-Pleurochrysis_carterae.AAC.1